MLITCVYLHTACHLPYLNCQNVAAHAAAATLCHRCPKRVATAAVAAAAQDLRNIRAAAAYLQKTELKFDMTSAVDELRRQITLEFDFLREARVMDAVRPRQSTIF